MEDTFGSPSGNDQGHDVDAILAKAYGSDKSSTPAAEAPAQAAPAPAVKASDAPQFKEYEFNVRGQAVKIRDNDPRFQQWLSQGHDYSQNVQSFRQERDSWERQRQELEQKYTPYREIDAFAAKNPDWWNHVDQAYRQQQQQLQGVIDPVKSYLERELGPIKQDLPLMKQLLQEIQTQKQEALFKSQDEALAAAIKSVRESLPNLDFSAKDESGLSLEERVLKHAVDNKFRTFQGAFRDYYHDHLMQMAEARGRESVSKDMAKRREMGLLTDSPAPQASRATQQPLFANAKPKTWNDLRGEDILKEFKFG